MFTSQKTFGVNPYFSAPSPRALAESSEKPISPQEELMALQREREAFNADLKITKDSEVKELARAEIDRIDKRINELQTQMAEQAAQSSEHARKQIAATPGATPEEQAVATQALNQATEVRTEELQDQKNAVAEKTAAAQTIARQDVENSYEHRVLLQNSRIRLAWDESGNLAAESLVDVIANLDDDSKVEVQNQNWFNRVIRGRGEQRFGIGEAQVKELLRGKSVDELSALYVRLTGDERGLAFTQKDILGGEKNLGTAAGNHLSMEAMGRIKHLRQALITRSDALADIMQVIHSSGKGSSLEGMGQVRAGLASVIDGTEEQFLAALNDPAKAEEFTSLLTKSDILKRDPNVATRIIATLLRLGISVGANIISGGVLQLGLQETRYKAENLGQHNASKKPGEFRGDEKNIQWQNASVEASVGEKGRVGVDLNIASIDIFANWNDPDTVIGRGLTAYRQSADKRAASEKIVEQAERAIGNVKKEKLEVVQNISREFVRAQDRLLKQRDTMMNDNAEDPRIKELDAILENNVMIYVAKVLQERGMRLQGVYVSAGLSSAVFGVSLASVGTHATESGLNRGAGRIEARINSREVTQEQIEAKLADMGITREGNRYVQATTEKDARGKSQSVQKELFTLRENEAVSWNVDRVVDFRSVNWYASAQIVNTETKEVVKTVNIKIENPEATNEAVENNSAALVSAIQNIKTRGNREQRTLLATAQNHSSEGNVEAALQAYERLFRNNRDVKAVLEAAIAEAGNDADKKRQLIDLLLAKTSGGRESHELADRFEKNEDYNAVRRDLRKYYETTVAQVFANSYGMSKSEVMSLFDAMTEGGKSVSTLGSEASNGFSALVAYSQRHGFRKLDGVHNSNAAIFGKPQEVTGGAADKIRAEVQKTLSESAITSVMNQLKEAYGEGVWQTQFPTEKALREEAIKQLTAGKVHSYLSYEKDAECFNLGFFVEPGVVNIATRTQPAVATHRLGTGAIVAETQAAKGEVRIGAGVEYEKTKKVEEDDRTTRPDKGEEKQDVSTDTGGKVGEAPDTGNNVIGDGSSGNVTDGVPPVTEDPVEGIGFGG